MGYSNKKVSLFRLFFFAISNYFYIVNKNIFYIDYYADGKRIREAIGPNRRDAEKALAVRKAEILQGKFKLKPKKQRITFADFVPEFLEHVRPALKPRTYQRYGTSLRPLLEFFGNYQLAEISAWLIEKYKIQRRESVTGSTVNRDLACLRRLFNVAVNNGRLEQNPFNIQNIEFYREPKRSLKFLDEQQATALLAECKTDFLYLFTWLGLNTGLRHNELLALKWQDVDFENSFILLPETKAGNAQTVPMNQATVDILKKAKRYGDYVISKKNGERFQIMRKSFNSAARRAGLGHITPHVLRHTWATLLIKSGVSLRTVQELGRWSSVSLVERYSHVAESEAKKAAEHIGNIFNKQVPNRSQGQIMPLKGSAVNE